MKYIAQYTKRLTQKEKKWVDGFLVVRDDRSATLLDEQGATLALEKLPRSIELTPDYEDNLTCFEGFLVRIDGVDENSEQPQGQMRTGVRAQHPYISQRANSRPDVLAIPSSYAAACAFLPRRYAGVAAGKVADSSTAGARPVQTWRTNPLTAGKGRPGFTVPRPSTTTVGPGAGKTAAWQQPAQALPQRTSQFTAPRPSNAAHTAQPQPVPAQWDAPVIARQPAQIHHAQPQPAQRETAGMPWHRSHPERTVPADMPAQEDPGACQKGDEDAQDVSGVVLGTAGTHEHMGSAGHFSTHSLRVLSAHCRG